MQTSDEEIILKWQTGEVEAEWAAAGRSTSALANRRSTRTANCRRRTSRRSALARRISSSFSTSTDEILPRANSTELETDARRANANATTAPADGWRTSGANRPPVRSALSERRDNSEKRFRRRNLSADSNVSVASADRRWPECRRACSGTAESPTDVRRSAEIYGS